MLKTHKELLLVHTLAPTITRYSLQIQNVIEEEKILREIIWATSISTRIFPSFAQLIREIIGVIANKKEGFSKSKVA